MTLSILDAARDAPDHPALIAPGRTWTFRELAARAKELAAAIEADAPRDRGVPMALDGASTEDALCSLYALFELGRPVLLLHPRWSPAERSAYLRRAGNPPLVRPSALAGDTIGARFPESTDDEAPLAIIATSGTSATPKGVVLSRRAFVASAMASAHNLGWRDDDRWLLALPVAHVGGLSIVTRCLLAHKTVVLTDRSAASSAESLISAIEGHRITLLSLVPTQLHFLLAHRPSYSPPAYLRAILVGGAGAQDQLLHAARERGFRVLTTYGLTEACSQVTTQPYETAPDPSWGSGLPVPGTEVRIDDGTIRIRGSTLFSGYFPQDHVDTPPFDGDGWFDTRDHGFFDERGNLHVLGRGTDLILTGGENVHPLAVERIVETCEGVRAACVFGIPDDVWGQVVAVALVTGDAFSIDALAVHCKSRLAPHERPRRYALVETLSMTEAGKLDRRTTARRALPDLQTLDAPFPGS